MDDLISRQAAIDAINTWPKYGVDERNRIVPWYEGLVPYVYLEDVVKAIVGLPSAKPEIIRCKDCKHHWIHRCMDSMPTEICDLDQTFYDAYVDFCSLAERRTDG